MMLNIIHLEKRKDRYENLMRELCVQGITDYQIWPGIIDKQPKVGVSRAHKQVIRFAKENNFDKICVAEDDILFTAPGAWEYFLKNIPEDFDLYVGSYYQGTHDENYRVKNFCGLTLYIVNSRFYDKFLAMSENRHIDKAIGSSDAKIIVCPLFVATQMSGYSDQRKRFADDSKRMDGKRMYHGEHDGRVVVGVKMPPMRRYPVIDGYIQVVKPIQIEGGPFGIEFDDNGKQI